jgi:isopenicillin N synthase-like dioxygenase
MQWPEEEDLPGFKKTFLRYLKAVENLSNEFTGLVAEAFGLPSDGLARFYGARADRIQHRSKVRLVRPPPHTPQSLN